MVTDSTDVAEARDTLEVILAFDRADIPAVTQRRTLAHQQPEATRQAPTPTGRCVIPEWFEPLLSELRGELRVAEQAATDSEAERARLAAAAAAAKGDLTRVEAATAPAREQLAATTGRADQARWQHTDAQRRLDATGWRGRRAARHELAVAEVRHERAVEHLQHTRHRTRPDIANYNQARARLDETRTALDRHDTRVWLRHTLDQAPILRRQIEILDTWRRWAGGDTINVQQLGDTIEQLTSISRRDEHADQFHALGEAAATGPVTPASTCRRGGDTPERLSEPDSNLDCDGGQRAPQSGRPRLEGDVVGTLAIAPKPLDRPETGLPDSVRGTNLARGYRGAEHFSPKPANDPIRLAEPRASAPKECRPTFGTANRQPPHATVQGRCIAPSPVQGINCTR